MPQKMLHVDDVRDAVHLAEHFILRRGVVLQRKGQILRHRESDKLSVGVLQHRADPLAHAEHALLFRDDTVHQKASTRFAGKGAGIECVNAVGKRRLAAARRSGDEDLLAGIDVQIDMAERRLLLGTVLKGKILE